MPPATSQPERAAALFPQAVPAARTEMSPRMYKARHLRADTTEAIKQEALRVIDHWNATFRDIRGNGASLAQRAGWNINAYTRFRSACERSGGMFTYTADDVCRAITAYRKNPANVKLRSWMPFKKWLDVENVDKLIGAARVQQHAVDQKAAAKADTAKRKAWALAIIRHRKVVDAAVRAHKSGSTLDAMCQKTQREAKAAGNQKAHDWCARTRSFIASLRALDPAKQAAYAARAEDVYTVAYGKPPGCEPEVPARLQAIQIVLLDYDIQRNQEKGSP